MQISHLTKDTWEEGLRSEDFFNDSDWNGENGLDYVDDEAQEKGFESNLDFHIAKGKELYKDDWKKSVIHVLDAYVNSGSNESYYDVLQYDKVEVGEDLVVALVNEVTE